MAHPQIDVVGESKFRLPVERSAIWVWWSVEFHATSPRRETGNGSCRYQVLEMDFGSSSVARASSAKCNHRLRNCPFHASPSRTLGSKVRGLLALTRPLLRFKISLRRQDRERPPLFMIISTEGDDRTHRAIRVAELNFHHWAV